MSRYALYFCPEASSPWWQAGCCWLGRDPKTNQAQQRPVVPGLAPALFQTLSAHASRYAFHATLKAPFHLADAFSETHLLEVLEAFCRAQKCVRIEQPHVTTLGDFLALRPAQEQREINALAMRCVSYFDFLRAPPTDTELVKRRSQQLTIRQEQLLRRWGYPYTEEEYRFHMTLSDSLQNVDNDTAYRLRRAAEDFFTLDVPLVVDGIALFREEHGGADFTLMQRFPFAQSGQPHSLPAMGRLFYLVGPAGCGKDSLLHWLRTHLSDSNPDSNPNSNRLFIAPRTITRPVHGDDDHESIAPETFWQLAAAGQFAMSWQNYDLCYGIRRGFEACLKAGRDVLISGSREYVPQLLQQYPQAQVIWLEAPHEVLHQRLRTHHRNQDSEAALLRRMERIQQFQIPQEPNIVRIEHAGEIETAGKALLRVMFE